MFTEPVHHVYDSTNHVLAHNLTKEELEDKLKDINQEYEVLTLDPPNYKDASY